MPIEAADYAAFAMRVIADGWLPDPWLEGAPRLAPTPHVLTPASAARFCTAAEGVALAHDELCRLLAAEPDLLEPLNLQPVQQALWWSSAPAWHGLARADVFETAQGGIQICELNCDTPTGIAESVVLGRLLAAPGGADANQTLLDRWVALLRRAASARGKLDRSLTAGLVWPTEQTEDMPMLLLWRAALEDAGWRVVDGSPFNLGLGADGRATLLGTACDVVVRHYKTDWWAERRPAWRDEPPVPDSEPLLEPLRVLLEAEAAGATTIVNPMGAIVPQNKRFLALLWRHRDRLSEAGRRAVETWIPPTELLEDVPAATLLAEQAAWVLKSDYGCEGDEVVVGAEVTAEVWQRALEQAVPGRWVAQRWFEAARNAAGEQVNLGVYLIGGEAAGLLARRSRQATDQRAVMATVQIANAQEEPDGRS
ncbi:MAG: glutathionylspermidine synthase family protein [Deltaproteobacteria bacterium]|nr:glutathionylspermidine synthase family protein [Deltaproteobacteria bacterium]